MTHRHKTQTDEYQAYKATIDEALAEGRFVDALQIASNCCPMPRRSRPTDSNTSGGKA